ncbi:MAG: hypothetical protein ACREN8_03505 [Candidatus Dormibacteraceae bacterium]
MVIDFGPANDPVIQIISGPHPDEYPEVLDAWFAKLNTQPTSDLDISAADMLSHIRNHGEE